MAKKSSADFGFFLVDGFDIMADTTKIEHNVEAITEDVHGLGDNFVQNEFVGLKSFEALQEGFFTTGEQSTHETLSGKTGANRIVCMAPDGNKTGDPVTGFEGALQTNFKRITGRGELIKANAEYKGAGQVDEGIVLHPHSTEIEDGDTEAGAVTIADATAKGGAAYLQVSEIDLDGYDSVTIKVLHKGTGAWSDLIEFTVVDHAQIAERKTVQGIISKNLAVSWEFNGDPVAAEPSIKFAVGFARFK